MKKYLLLFLMCVYASIGAWAITVTVDNSSTETNANNYYVTVTSTSSDQWWPQGNGWQVVAKNVTFTGDYSGLTWSDAGGNVYNLGGMNSRFDFSNATGVTFANLGTMLSAYNSGTSTYPFDGVTKVVLPTGMTIPSDISSLNRSGNLKFVFSTIDSSTGEYQIYVTSNLTSTSDLSEDITSSVITALQGTGTIKIVGDPTAVALVQNWLINTNSVPAANITAVPTKDPIEYDSTNTCVITINRDYSTDTVEDLIGEAQNHLSDGDASTADICTIIINGTLDVTDLNDLGCSNAAGVTRIDLSEATLATGAAITSLQVPSTLVSLVLPPNQTVKGTTLANTLSKTNCPNLLYAYSPSSDCTATGPNQADKSNTTTYKYDDTKNTIADYVWVNKAGGLAMAFENEEQLRNSFYIKVASSEELTATDVNFNGCTNKPTNYLFLDFSESNLTPTVAASYTVTDNIGYRIILPNGWTGDDMAVFAANPYCGNLAAVYSYDGTTLKIMEIVDASYSQAALANPRIMRSGTTEVDVISGYYDGTTYAQFGTNLLAALNNMGKSEFSVTTKDANNNDVVTNYTNTLGQSVKTISIKTTSAAPNALTFDNPSITTLKAENLVQNNAELNVSACSALTSLSVKGSNLKSVTASGNTSITSADLSGAAIATTTNFNGATSLATFNTTGESIFNGNVDLTSSALTGFTSEARFGGDVSLNNTNTLTSIDVSGATFTTTTSNIHIDESATENAENKTIITGLTADNCIVIPSSFDKSRLHPAPTDNLVKQISPVVAAVTYAASDMVFHDAETTGGTPDKFRYWYQGTETANQIATVGTSTTRTLNDVIAGNTTEGYTCDAHADLTNDTHVMIKVVGPLKANDLDSLKYLNATAIDLSDAVIEEGVLAARLKNANILNANTKFLILPDTCSREHILNEATLSKQTGVYSVIAINTTDEGRDLTSWSKVSGALQPAVVIAGNRSCQSWTKTPDGKNARNIYTSDISNFKKLKISGLINSYDLSKADQKLDAGGHLSWAEAAVEAVSQTRTQNGAYTVYGPFSACFLLTEIDLKNAYFEPWSNQQTGEGYFTRYWVSDMTLSALNVISTATYKVVIPQDSRVNEVPADFLRCSTNIRAICIPSNIRVIRTRAFYTIDYVWTTSASGLGMEGNDPEGTNTRLDNGAKLKTANGSDFIKTSALIYENGAYKENPAFTKECYVADYSTINGGGTYTFGSNLRLIETGAFANTQPHVKDVYVLNTTAPECHVDAFNTVMYTGNGGYSSISGDQKIITRENYFNNGFWITMLHYPRQTTTPNVQRYTDPTREYSIATGERDGKGAPIYYPNQSEFIRAYQQGTYGYVWNAWNPTREYGSVNNGTLTNTTSGWTAENQTTANGLFDAYTTGGTNHQYTSFAGVNDSTSVTKTTTTLVPYYQVQYGSGSYSTAETQGNLYPKSEILEGRDVDNSGEPTAKDYRGWHQFVLNAYAANTVLKEEPYRSYITDNEWWTICPTFDITREEAIKLFGTPASWTSGVEKIPYVSKLRYVRRTYRDQKITLNFSDNLMVYKETRTNATDQHGTLDDNGVMNVGSGKDTGTPNSGDVVMSAGVPYLIKPNMTAVNGGFNRQFRVYTNEDYIKLSDEQKSATSPRAINSTSLYNKIKAAQEMSGEEQIAIINSGKYTVPVFVSGRNDGETAGYEVEDVEMENGEPKPYTIASSPYEKSTTWKYTFVGSFYKSFLPHYCYYLGWDSSLNSGNGGARFFYLDGEKGNPGVFTYYDNNMNWNNETGVICPTKGDFSYTVTPASGLLPATWIIGAKSPMRTSSTAANNDFLPIDSYVMTGGSGAKAYEMVFGAPDVIADNSEVTGISNIDANNSSDANNNTDVYTINGQKVGTSLEGLPKGIYIVNGKKFIVK